MDRHTDGARGPRGRGRLVRTVTGTAEQTDPFAFVAASWWLALVAIAVLQQAHEGLHEHLELAPLLHIARDAALAVPGAAIAVAAGLFAAAAIGGTGPAIRRRTAWVAATAVAFAAVSIPGNQLHGVLFGAEAEEGLSPVADAALDAGIALLGALLALVPIALVVGTPSRPVHAAVPDVSEPSPGPHQGPTDFVARSAQ